MPLAIQSVRPSTLIVSISNAERTLSRLCQLYLLGLINIAYHISNTKPVAYILNNVLMKEVISTSGHIHGGVLFDPYLGKRRLGKG